MSNAQSVTTGLGQEPMALSKPNNATNVALRQSLAVPEVKLERTPSVDSINFSANNPLALPQKASMGKKIGVGTASLCVPGLGQMINGENWKAAAFFGGSVASFFTGALCPWLLLGIIPYSMIDAYRNAKP